MHRYRIAHLMRPALSGFAQIHPPTTGINIYYSLKSTEVNITFFFYRIQAYPVQCLAEYHHMAFGHISDEDMKR